MTDTETEGTWLNGTGIVCFGIIGFEDDAIFFLQRETTIHAKDHTTNLLRRIMRVNMEVEVINRMNRDSNGHRVLRD